MDKATPTLRQRCDTALQSLPDAPYRAMLAALFDEMLAEVERLAAHPAPVAAQPSQAPVVQAGDANAPAVRMLTEDEVAQATEDGERSFRRWTQGVRGQTLMPQDSPTFHYVMAGAAKALAVNAGKRIPADGKIGGAA